MCLIPGLADGRFLVSNEFLDEDDVTSAICLCAGGGGAIRRTVAVNATFEEAADLEPPDDDAIVFLGTGGGPVLHQPGAQPSTALLVNGTCYLVDAGADVVRQLQKAKIS